MRRRGSYTRYEMHQTEARHPVARILRKPQHRQHVLDVRAVEKLQTAELDEGNVAAGELHFERAAVVRSPEQHGLLLQQSADLPVLQHALDDVARLVRLVANADELRTFGRLTFRPQILGEAFSGEINHAVGGGKDGLRRTIIAIERDDVRRRAEMVRKIENVAHRGSAERIDRLCVVADNGKAADSGLERQQDRGLKAIGVLIFVDQNMIEPPADIAGEHRIAHGLRPVEEQIVIVEDVLRLLRLDIESEQLPKLYLPTGAPRIDAAQHFTERKLCIHGA